MYLIEGRNSGRIRTTICKRFDSIFFLHHNIGLDGLTELDYVSYLLAISDKRKELNYQTCEVEIKR